MWIVVDMANSFVAGFISEKWARDWARDYSKTQGPCQVVWAREYDR